VPTGKAALKQTFNLPSGREALRACLNGLPKDKRYTITVAEYKKSRTLDQNAYWWKVIATPMAQFCGYTPDEMHEELCGQFFGWKTVEFRGHKREKPRRTTTTPDMLEVAAFTQLIEWGHQMAAEMGIVLPQERQEAA
jgi:hypothetical protein